MACFFFNTVSKKKELRNVIVYRKIELKENHGDMW